MRYGDGTFGASGTVSDFDFGAQDASASATNINPTSLITALKCYRVSLRIQRGFVNTNPSLTLRAAHSLVMLRHVSTTTRRA
jgi:hypothetical protein